MWMASICKIDALSKHLKLLKRDISFLIVHQWYWNTANEKPNIFSALLEIDWLWMRPIQQLFGRANIAL